MKFRNYCLVVMGETDNIQPEIFKISETHPNVLDSKGIVIATFTSVVEPKELTDYFKSRNRNFLIFDLDAENSGFNINRKDIHNSLFGFLNEMTENILKKKSDDLIQEVTSTTKSNISHKVNTIIKKDKKILIEDIDNMSPKDKNDLMNKLIDKGVNNLSEYDKKILKKLSI
jgi:hypothetical protein